MKRIFCALAGILCITLCCCAPQDKTNLTNQYTRSDSVPVYDFYDENTELPEKYSSFKSAYYDFTAALLASKGADSSTLVSPLSLYSALALTSNGAAGSTLKDLEKVIGDSVKTADINECIHYLNSRVSAFNSENNKLLAKSSLWVQDGFSVKAQFLQTAVNYFDSGVYRTELSKSTIGNWLSENIEGKFSDISTEIDENALMLLCTSAVFSDSWATPYYDSLLSKGSFNGKETEFMTSTEHILSSDRAKAFVKNFANTPCKFVAILPNEGISIEEYLSSLKGSEFTTLFDSFKPASLCNASIPSFSITASDSLKENLTDMGLGSAFSEDANFTALTMNDGLHLSDVTEANSLTISVDGAKRKMKN